MNFTTAKDIIRTIVFCSTTPWAEWPGPRVSNSGDEWKSPVVAYDSQDDIDIYRTSKESIRLSDEVRVLCGFYYMIRVEPGN